jgi:malonate transporter and related proteins
VSALVGTMFPIFGLMAIGYGSARARLMQEAGVRGLVLFVFNFSIPALLFDSMAGLTFPEDLEWGFLLAFYLASFITYGLGAATGRFAFRRSLDEQAIFGMGAAFSNLVLMGLPIVLTALGPDAALPMLLIIGFHSVTFMPLTVALIQADRGDGGTRGQRVTGIFVDVLRNPIILGILAGLFVNLGGIPLWTGIASIIDFLAAAAVPCALFAMGASLATYPLRGDVAPAVLLTTLKLVVHPLLVWLIAVPVLGLQGLAVSVAVVMASMPSAVNVYLFGERYRAAPGIAARTVLLTSVCSMLTIAVALSLVGG